jgi:hypothetical protein
MGGGFSSPLKFKMSFLILISFILKEVYTKEIPIHPDKIKIQNKNIVIGDFKNQKIFIFDIDLSSYTEIIKGIGSKLDEAKLLCDFDIFKNLLCISDGGNNRIILYDIRKKSRNSFVLPQPAMNVMTNGENLILTPFPGEKESLFYKYSLNGTLLESFGKIKYDLGETGSLIASYILDPENKIIYEAIPFDKIIIYDFYGKVIGEIKKGNWLYILNLRIYKNNLYLSGIMKSKEIEDTLLAKFFKKSLIKEFILHKEKIKILKKISENLFYGLDIYDTKNKKWILKDFDLTEYGIFGDAKGDSIWIINPSEKKISKYILIKE